MYLAIWWVGVNLSNHYLDGGRIGFANVKLAILTLAAICCVLAANVLFAAQAGLPLRAGHHPILEFRHFGFALAVLVVALLWAKLHWIAYRMLFYPFALLAPVSYVIYISHYYFVLHAAHFHLLKSRGLEMAGWLICLILFSYLLEVRIYPPLRRKFLALTNHP